MLLILERFWSEASVANDRFNAGANEIFFSKTEADLVQMVGANY